MSRDEQTALGRAHRVHDGRSLLRASTAHCRSRAPESAAASLRRTAGLRRSGRAVIIRLEQCGYVSRSGSVRRPDSQKVPSRPTSRWSGRPSSTYLSISRPPGRSGSPCRRRCYCERTRSLNNQNPSADPRPAVSPAARAEHLQHCEWLPQQHVRPDRWLAFARRGRSTWALKVMIPNSRGC
jgi:hypothetical protein